MLDTSCSNCSSIAVPLNSNDQNLYNIIKQKVVGNFNNKIYINPKNFYHCPKCGVLKYIRKTQTEEVIKISSFQGESIEKFIRRIIKEDQEAYKESLPLNSQENPFQEYSKQKKHIKEYNYKNNYSKQRKKSIYFPKLNYLLYLVVFIFISSLIWGYGIGKINYIENNTNTNINKPKEKEKKELNSNDLLYSAVNTGDLKSVKKSINEGIDPNKVFKSPPSGTRNSTPLHIAAQKGHADIVKFLLKEGSNPNKKDSLGGTPLHEAANYHNPVIADYLLKAGANPNVQDNSGQTPLHFAATTSLKIVRKLLEAGANPNLQDDTGETPLHHATAGPMGRDDISNQSPEIVKTLLEAGAKPNILTNNNDFQCNTPWQHSSMNNKYQEKIIDILKKYGAKPPETVCKTEF